MAELIDGKKISQDLKDEVKEKVAELKAKGIEVTLAVILVGNDPASTVYVGNKKKACEYTGINSRSFELPEETTQEELMKLIKDLNEDDSVNGILVQLPLPKHLDEDKVIRAISPDKDVDGFHPMNLGSLVMGNNRIVACTPKGIMMILKETGVDLTGKTAVVVGRSVIVGKPISQLLLNANATVITCHSKTVDLKKYTKMADILVVAAGVPHLVTEDMVKKGSIVIDVGINRIDGKIVGDVDTENVKKVAKYITPVPGGVGITTVVSLLGNLIEMAENNK